MTSRYLPLVVLVALLASLSACIKTPTVGFENATQDKIILRASVDDWYYVKDCDSGRDRGAINRQGNFSMDPNSRLCMKVQGRKDSLPAGELISQVDVIRDARRCVTLSRDQIIDGQKLSRGFSVYTIDDELCPAAIVPAASIQDDEDADDDLDDDDDDLDDEQDDD